MSGQTMITFPFITVLTAFSIVGIISVFLGYKVKQNSTIVVNSRWVVLTEILFNFFSNIVAETVGDKYIKKLTPLAMTMFLTIFIGNMAVLFGFQEAATDFNFPFTWAITMFVFWNAYGIYKIGIGAFIKDFFSPMWWMFPIEIIGFVTKPVTLMIRMFGNITSGFIMMGIFWALPEIISNMSIGAGIFSMVIFVPVGGLLSFYFSIFEPFIQAMVFTYLVLVNLALIINEEEE